MKTKLLFIVSLMFFTLTNAQFNKNSLEIGVGSNLHSGALNGAQIGAHGNILYRYSFTPIFSLGARASYDNLKSDHFECKYNTEAINFTPEIFVKLFKYKKIAGIGHTGVGYSKLNSEDVLNYTVGGDLLYSLGKTLNLKLGYMATSYVFQKNNLDGSTLVTSNGINSYTNQLYAGLAIPIGNNGKSADFYTKPNFKVVTKEKETIIKEIIREQNIVTPVEYVFFKEGKTNIDKSSLNAITTIHEFLLLNPDYKVAIVGSACGGHGSPERNLWLSKKRAENVANKLHSMGIHETRISHRGVGVDTRFRHEDQDAQKRVEFIIYK